MPELDLLVVGDVNPDVVVSDPELLVQFGQAERIVDQAALVVGGSASITAIGAARLGCSVGICGVIGADSLGDFMSGRLSEEGVDASHLRRVEGTPTGLSVVLNRGADRAILTNPGTIASLSGDDLQALPDRPAQHVHVSSYFLLSEEFRAALPTQLRRFRAAGATVSLDSNWDPTGQWKLDGVLDEVDVWVPNLFELLACTSTDDLADALALVASEGLTVVVKLGSEGAVATTANGRVRVSVPSDVVTADAIGAGDSFSAGFLSARLAGLDVADAVRWGVAAGTLSTRGLGGTARQPTRDELETVAAGLTVDADSDGAS